MDRLTRTIPLFLVAALVGLANASTPSATFEGLGFLPNTDHSFPRSISADGSTVVGGSGDLNGYLGLRGGYLEAFRWTRQGGLQGLGDFPGGFASSAAIAVSADGSVIAGTGSTPAGNLIFRWTAADGMVAVPPPAPYPNNGATSISRDGSVITGTMFGTPTGGGTDFEPMQWRASTSSSVGLGLPAGARYAVDAYASGDGGVVVGRAKNIANASGFAFRWTPSEGMQALEPANAQAMVVSADGRVIAGRVPGVGLGIWRNGGILTNIGTLGSYSRDVDARAMTPDGSIIVGSERFDASHSHAYIWDQAHGMRDLNVILPQEYGVDLGGWVLESAAGISDDGNFITGWGTDPQGRVQAWLVSVPEPGGALLLLSLAALSRRRR